MNIPLTNRWMLQVVYWPCLRKPFVWAWPRTKSSRPKNGKPLFYGIGVACIELRLIDQTWGDPRV